MLRHVTSAAALFHRGASELKPAQLCESEISNSTDAVCRPIDRCVMNDNELTISGAMNIQLENIENRRATLAPKAKRLFSGQRSAPPR